MKKYLLLSCFIFLSIVVVAIYAADKSDKPSPEEVEKFINKLPPAALQFLQEKGIDLDKVKTDQELQNKVRKMLKNPKVRRKIFEKRRQKAEKIQQKQKNKSEPRSGRIPSKPDKKKEPQPEKKQDQGKKRGGLPSIYQSIITKNLFRPLGWTYKKPGPSFMLCGIVSSSNDTKVLLQRQGSSEGYYVGVGDTIADGYKVEEITKNSVKLKKDGGEDTVLKLSAWVPRGGSAKPSFGSSPGGKPSAKRGGKKRSGSGERPSSSKKFTPPPGGLPPMIQKILDKEGLSIQDVMSNPALQKKLRSKYEPMMRGQ